MARQRGKWGTWGTSALDDIVSHVMANGMELTNKADVVSVITIM